MIIILSQGLPSSKKLQRSLKFLLLSFQKVDCKHVTNIADLNAQLCELHYTLAYTLRPYFLTLCAKVCLCNCLQLFKLI